MGFLPRTTERTRNLVSGWVQVRGRESWKRTKYILFLSLATMRPDAQMSKLSQLSPGSPRQESFIPLTSQSSSTTFQALSWAPGRER